jgi:FeS assembly SUF system regulator
MLRISRLTDYGTVVMSYLAMHAQQALNAKEIALRTHLAQPTVSKLLKMLTRAGLLQALRGAKGGYSLAMSAEKISLVQIINAIEGNIALTECSHDHSNCSMETLCNTRSHWQVINKALHNTLNAINLGQLIGTSTIAVAQLKKQLKHHDTTSH